MKIQIAGYKKTILFCFCLILIFYSMLHFVKTGIVFSFERNQVKGDFAAYWPTHWAWTLNPEIMTELTSQPGARFVPEDKKSWLIGPLVHFLFYPLLFLNSFTLASHIWLGICLVLVLITLYLWYKILFIDQGYHSFLTLSLYIAVWLNFFPLYECVTARNIEILECFFLTLCFHAFLKSRDKSAGVYLAMAAMLKFLPVIFLPYFFIKQKYKLVISCLITLLIIGAATEFTLGWKNSHTLWQMFKKRPFGYGTTLGDSQAIPSAIHRSLPTQGYAYGKVSYPQLALWTTRIVVLLMVLFYMGYFWFTRGRPFSLYEISILLILMVSLSWKNHIYYLYFLLIPVSIFLQKLVQQFKVKQFSFSNFFLFVFIYMCLGIFFPFHILRRLIAGNLLDYYEFYNIPVYGYLILLIWLTVTHLKSSRQVF